MSIEDRVQTRVKFCMFVAGCVCFGYEFGWLVGTGTFLCAPAFFAAIRGK